MQKRKRPTESRKQGAIRISAKSLKSNEVYGAMSKQFQSKFSNVQ